MRYWFDIESQEIITENDLKYEYNIASGDKEYKGVSFEEYINNCLTSANGTLMEIKNAYLFEHI